LIHTFTFDGERIHESAGYHQQLILRQVAMEPTNTPPSIPVFRFALLTGLMIGTLDGTAAVIDFLRTYHGNPLIAFQYIAGGILGARTFAGGLLTSLLGILLHYLIATSWTVLFFLLYPRMKLLRGNWIIVGVLYAVFVWLAMNLGVRPLSRVPHVPWTALKIIKSTAILIIAVGLPISFTAKKFFRGGQAEAFQPNEPQS
jgi:hypothetical protein